MGVTFWPMSRLGLEFPRIPDEVLEVVGTDCGLLIIPALVMLGSVRIL